jgi:hypothetical protein
MVQVKDMEGVNYTGSVVWLKTSFVEVTFYLDLQGM